MVRASLCVPLRGRRGKGGRAQRSTDTTQLTRHTLAPSGDSGCLATANAQLRKENAQLVQILEQGALGQALVAAQ
jgi:hypothetical protein